MKLKKESCKDPAHALYYYQSSKRKGVPIFTEEKCRGHGGYPDNIPRKKSKAQDPVETYYYY
jgi:hypothetical protein